MVQMLFAGYGEIRRHFKPNVPEYNGKMGLEENGAGDNTPAPVFYAQTKLLIDSLNDNQPVAFISKQLL